MRHLILCMMVLFLASCATDLKVIYPEETFYNIDFTPYSAKNFLMTPEMYDGKYESIGMIDFTAKPGAQYTRSSRTYHTSSNGQKVYEDVYKWQHDIIMFDEVLQKVYDICVKMGADALVNFRTEITEDDYPNLVNPTIILGYRITGFAIKRKESNTNK